MYNQGYNSGRMQAKLRKWGNSLGLLVPAVLAREKGLRDGDIVEFEIRRRILSVEELGGTVKFRRPLREVLQEMEEGWNDR